MERAKKMIRAVLFPKAAVIVLCAVLAVLSLIYTFGFYGTSGWIAYVSYIFSAYALVIVCIGLWSMKNSATVKRMKDTVLEMAGQNPYVSRYRTDIIFKTKISLLLSMALNTGYAVLKFVAGIFYGSAWLITLAAYYTLLLTMRFLLVLHIHRNTRDMAAEWKRCRARGVVLLLMNIILTGMVILVLQRGEGFVYPGYLIYGMALYDFCAMTMAIVNLVKSRKRKSPVLTAAKVINVAAALIAMLSLETAMITQFGAEDGEVFRHTMIASTGGGICVVMVVMAVLMIARSTKSIKELKFQNG